jgi:hypothetical protein
VWLGSIQFTCLKIYGPEVVGRAGESLKVEQLMRFGPSNDSIKAICERVTKRLLVPIGNLIRLAREAESRNASVL